MQNQAKRVSHRKQWNQSKLNNLKIDSRTDDDIKKRIAQLAESYVPEWKFDENHPDIGSVIGILYAKQMMDSIDKYNGIIGGYSNSDDSKVQGINEKVNLYNQQIAKSDKSKTKVIKRSKEEQNKARSEKLLGHEVSLETRKKLSEKNKGIKPSNTGKIQITNGIVNKYILLEDFSKYEIEG